jgi:tight adherence protein B
VIYLVFTVVMWIGITCLWLFAAPSHHAADAAQVRARLSVNVAATPSKKARRQRLVQERQEVGQLLRRLLGRFDLLPKAELLIEQAGLKWRPARFVHGCMAAFLAGFFLTRLLAPSSVARFSLVIGAATAYLPVVYAKRKRTARMRKFEEQFPECLDFIARSMRAGHAFPVSLEMIHREFQQPLSGEFRRVSDEHSLGLALDAALLGLQARVPSLDVHFFVSAVLLQRRTGGNLAEVLEKLAYINRERSKLRGRIRAVSAHGRMTGSALSLIPLSVALMMFFINPEGIRFFFVDETGQKMAAFAVGLQLAGYAIINKIVKIEL